jgi:heterodisulfide reductase subunit B
VKDEIKYPFDDFSVAFYAGSFDCDALVEVNKEAQNLLSALGAKVVNFASSDDADGFDIAPYNENIAFKKAGNIVLDAFDSGADIVVVDNKESHFMMDQSVKKCEKATGRDIRISILNISQMVALAIGITDKEKLGLDQHKIKPEFI